MGVLLLGAVTSAGEATASGPMRVLFDEEFSWLTKEGADRLVARASETGFTVIVPCVWHGRGVSWPSEQTAREPRWEQHAARNPDPLRYLITRAHASGIQIYPWFTIALRQGNLFPEFAEPGTPEKAFNVHASGFRAWMVALILEVVTRYDVDGINLDYVRTKGHCSSRTCERAYLAKYGRDLQQDIATRAVSPAARAALSAWNSAAVGDVVERVAREGRRIKPSLTITIDSLAGDPLWMEQGANGLVWADNGWIDVIFHMDYGDPLNTPFLTGLKPRVKDPRKVAILIGNYFADRADSAHPQPRSGAEVHRLLKQADQLWPESGITALYEYRFITDDQAGVLRRHAAENNVPTSTP